MVSQVGALRVTVGANINPLQADMRRAERVVAKSAGSMSRAVKGVNNSLTGLGSIAGVSLGGAGLLAGVGAFLKVADAAKQIEAQLKLATREFGSFSKAQKDVQRIAEVTRSGLVETANLYATFQRNAKELSLTQEESARATETVIKTFQISGATAEEAAGGLRQFLQALQSGQLRGEEFNSVMENAPRLAKLLADSLKVTIGELRAMAKEGQLTGDKLKAALTDRKFTEQIDEEFRQLPVTFSQAMTQVYNSAVIVFSEFDKGGQFSNSIVNFVTDGTEGFKNLGDGAREFGRDVGDTFAAIETIREALASLTRDGLFGFGELIDVTYSWRDALHDVLVGIDAVVNSFANFLNGPGNLTRLLAGGRLGQPIINPVDLSGEFDAKVGARDLEARFGAAREAQSEGDVRLISLTVQKAIEDIRTKRASGQPIKQSELDHLKRLTTELEASTPRNNPPPFRAPPGKDKKAKKGPKPPRDRSDDVEFQFAQELRQAQMDVLRAQQSMAVTNDERARLALQILDAERAMKEAELNDRVRRAERDFADKKITAGALEQVKAQAEKLRAEYDNADSLERQAVANELAAQKAQDAAALVDSDYNLRLELLQNEAALAETVDQKRAVELRILDLMKKQEKARLGAVLADVESSELAKEEARRRLAALDEIYNGRAAAAAAQNRSPIEEYKAKYSDIGEENQEAIVNGLEGMADALSRVTEGWDAMKKAALDTLQTLVQTLLRNQINQLFASLLPAPGGFGAMPGFASGGFTGNVPRNKIAGVVHGQEGVLNARAMANLGVPNLDILNRGAPLSAIAGNDNMTAASGGDLNVSVSLPQGMRQHEGRETGRQIARGMRDRMVGRSR